MPAKRAPETIALLRPPPSHSQRVERHTDAAVEDPDWKQVEQVDHEAEVGEGDQQARALGAADEVARERRDTAEDRPGDRDSRCLPRIPAGVLDIGAEERDEDRPGRMEALAPRLEPVPHLVDEDQQDDTEPEAPAPDQRVAAECDEDEPELGERAELYEEPEQDDEGGAEPAKRRAPVGAARLDRLVLAVAVRLHPSEVVPARRADGAQGRAQGRSRCQTPLQS